MNAEDLIRESLRKQADRAPQPHAVLAALRTPRRRNWTPLVIAVAATASVLAAVVVTTRPTDSAEPVTTSTVATSPDRSAGPVGAVPLRFEPRWLPDGFVETGRTLGHGGYTRLWVDPADPGRSLRLGVHPSGSEYWAMENAAYEGTGNHVDLGAKGQGAHTPVVEPGRVTLMWPGDGGEQLKVETVNVPDPLGVAERFAESLESDGDGEHAPVITLPPEYADRPASGDSSYSSWSGTSPTEWTVEVVVRHVDRAIAVRLSTAAPKTTGGETVRARGVDATFIPAKKRGDDWTDVVLVVPVGDRFLTVAGESTIEGEGPERSASRLTEEDLVDIATSTKIADHPDVSWFGTR